MQFIAEGLPIIKMATNKMFILFKIAKNSKCLFDPLLLTHLGVPEHFRETSDQKLTRRQKFLKFYF